MTTKEASTGVNHELFVEVLAHIEREPQLWDQRVYVNDCGTAHCFAGWASVLSGGPQRQVGLIYEAAVAALGLPERHDDDDYDYDGELFGRDNTLSDLYRISAELMGVDQDVLRDKVAAEVQAS